MDEKKVKKGIGAFLGLTDEIIANLKSVVPKARVKFGTGMPDSQYQIMILDALIQIGNKLDSLLVNQEILINTKTPAVINKTETAPIPSTKTTK